MASQRLAAASLAGFDAFLSSAPAAFAAANAVPAAPMAPAAGDAAAYDLRTRLAVRGWVNPRDVLDPEMSDEAATTALNAVADEADTAFGLKPGSWFLSAPARRRVLALRGLDVLRAELDVVRLPGDGADPVRLALRIAVGNDPLPPLEAIDVEVLRALGSAFDWFDGQPPVATVRPSLPADIVGELAARIHLRDLARLTEKPMVGQGHLDACSSLSRWLGEPHRKGLTFQYLYGSGGGGKSTVLGFVERALRDTNAATILVRIDFDDALVNAADSISLDIALLGQLEQRYPGLAKNATDRVAQLRHLQRNQKANALVTTGLRRRRVKREAQVQSLGLESVSSSARAERASMLYGILGFDRPLALVVDTAELIVTQGEAAMVELTGWVRSLTEGLGANDVRLLIAGRDPPGAPGCGDLVDRLAQVATQRPAIELRDLDVAEATRLIVECGVEDEDVARTAARAVPGNPLLLRITADALQSKELADEVRAAHDEDRVDPGSASSYLARRIVAHLADPAGRPYLLAAAHLPLIYRAVLRDVLIPQVDATPDQAAGWRPTDRVFGSLRRAQWLMRASADGRSLHFQRDVRALMLKLLASDPAQRNLAEKIHRRAAEFHAARRSLRDSAFALYHRAMLGDQPERPRNSARIVEQLGEAIDDLSPEWRAALRAPAPTARPGEPRPLGVKIDKAVHVDAPLTITAASRRPDEDWRLYLEGVGVKGGEGDRLLDRDHPEEALKLYRDRPTQPRGTPPTFVIRALADTGEWDSDEVDAAAILAESREWENARRLSPAALSRLYWITRLMLLRDNARLSPAHIEILRRACSLLSGEGLTTMPAIIAIAEAGAKTEILPERMATARGASQTTMRVSLVRAVIRQRQFALELPVEDIVVAQLDWRKVLAASAHRMIDIPQLDWVQNALAQHHDRPISEFNAALRDMGRMINLKWDGRDLTPAILVLRGQTTEFLRPLRQVLVDLYEQDHDGVLLHLLMPVIDRMSLRPVEFSSGRLAEALAQDSRAWCAAFVGFADRARLLPLLCNILVGRHDTSSSTATATARAARVAKSFLWWDGALCGGRSSEWPARY